MTTTSDKKQLKGRPRLCQWTIALKPVFLHSKKEFLESKINKLSLKIIDTYHNECLEHFYNSFQSEKTPYLIELLENLKKKNIIKIKQNLHHYYKKLKKLKKLEKTNSQKFCLHHLPLPDFFI